MSGKLNRFTTLPVLLDLLKRRRLVLLDPKMWEDKNDSGVMLEYKKRKGIHSLFAVCFSENDETIHHWKAFSDGISGCCIEFDREALLKCLDGDTRIRHGSVTYKKLRQLKDRTIELDDMPFIKRWPYRCEEEYRIIWQGKCDDAFFEIPIRLSCIRKITISQKMPQQIYDTIREYLREAFKEPDKRISRSTIYENKLWLAKFRKS